MINFSFVFSKDITGAIMKLGVTEYSPCWLKVYWYTRFFYKRLVYKQLYPI